MYISSLSAACSYCVPATGLMEISANLSYWDWNGLAQFRHRPLSICRLNLMHAFIISFRYTAQLCNLKTSSDKISIFELHLLRFWSVHSLPLGPLSLSYSSAVVHMIFSRILCSNIKRRSRNILWCDTNILHRICVYIFKSPNQTDGGKSGMCHGF